MAKEKNMNSKQNEVKECSLYLLLLNPWKTNGSPQLPSASAALRELPKHLTLLEIAALCDAARLHEILTKVSNARLIFSGSFHEMKFP